MIKKSRNDRSQPVADERGLRCRLEWEEGGTKHADRVSMGWMVAYKSCLYGLDGCLCKEVEEDDLSTLVLETESRISCRLGKYSHGP